MKGKTFAYSRLPTILTQRKWTVADLLKKLNAKGIDFDKKTLYRLASVKPIETLNARVLGAICEEIKVGIGDIITWEQPKPQLHRIDEATQDRLSVLMSRNNKGKLTAGETKELAELGAHAERLSMENARMLAGFSASGKKGIMPGGVAPKKAVRRRPLRPLRKSMISKKISV